eukprot:979258-Amphidinium_carterae.1
MVAEFASSIVNRASQFWDAIVLMCTGQYGHAGNDSDNDSDSSNLAVMAHTMPSEGSAPLRLYRNSGNMIGMI